VNPGKPSAGSMASQWLLNEMGLSVW